MPSKTEMHVRESDEKTLCICVWIQLYSSLIWEAGKCWHMFQLAYCMCYNTLFSFQHFPFESSNIQTKFILSGLYILQMKRVRRKKHTALCIMVDKTSEVVKPVDLSFKRQWFKILFSTVNDFMLSFNTKTDSSFSDYYQEFVSNH